SAWCSSGSCSCLAASPCLPGSPGWPASTEPACRDRPTPGGPRPAASEDAALHLVALDGLEQGLEVALAKALVALALDDLEEDRAERVLAEDLQQLALLGLRVGIDQDRVPAQPLHVLAVVGHALVDDVEVGVRGVEEVDPRLAHLLHRLVDVVGEQRDVLDALALVLAQVLVYLALLVGGLVE